MVKDPSPIPHYEAIDEKRGLKKLNGNRFVKRTHLFVSETEEAYRGCWFTSEAAAIAEAYTPNGVGLHVEQMSYEGRTWYRAGYTNFWE